MKSALKFLIPVVLGVAAAIFNFISLSSSSRTTDFIMTTEDMELYDVFDLDRLQKAPVPARFADAVRGCAMLYSDRSALVGQRATRKMKAGSLIFYRDAPTIHGALVDLRADWEAALPVSMEGSKTPPGIMHVGDEIDFRIPIANPEGPNGDSEAAPPEGEWIGPFRLVSVGITITRDQDPAKGPSDVSHVAVAYDIRPESKDRAQFDKLIDFIDRSVSDERAKLISYRHK